MRTKHQCVLIHSRIKGKVGTLNMFKPISNYFTDHSKAVLLLLLVFCDFYTVLSVPFSFVFTCWERTDILALLCVIFSFVLSLSYVVSWVRCGI